MQDNTIIIVENDETTALDLSTSLKKYGYKILAICDDTTQARVKISTLKPDIVLINISLKESNDGIELAKIIKRKNAIPFIYLTSQSNDNIISLAKETQPCGYMIKPFDPSLLHANIQIAIFRYQSQNNKNKLTHFYEVNKLDIEKLLQDKRITDEPIVEFGDGYHIDINMSETFYNNIKIKLTKKENAFLRLLVAQLGHVVSFEQAMNYVWDRCGATPNSVRTLVWRLRNKLATDVIKNTSGIGYYIEN
jgi:DNA-binding response OmpR family regulator